jgi:GntR family transcriptional regulator
MITIDYKDRRSLYRQIVEKVEELIAQGILESDQQLPSVRQLAVDLSINPNTIQKAYSELESRGVIYSVKGIGNFISSDLDGVLNNRKNALMTKLDELVREAVLLRLEKKELVEKCTEFYAKWREE